MSPPPARSARTDPRSPNRPAACPCCPLAAPRPLHTPRALGAACSTPLSTLCSAKRRKPSVTAHLFLGDHKAQRPPRMAELRARPGDTPLPRPAACLPHGQDSNGQGSQTSQQCQLRPPAVPFSPSTAWHRVTATKKARRYFCFVCKK